METTLLIMAAGIGSRFGGGIKQLASVDDYGHIIMDYSIHDAIEAGFRRVVFIIRRDIEADFKAVIGSRIEALCERLGVSVGYAFQSLSDIPGTLPEGRAKPWGTGQAVLCAREQIKGPFAVINADDYYGKQAFRQLHHYLIDHHKYNALCMAGFILILAVLTRRTAVTMGVCGGAYLVLLVYYYMNGGPLRGAALTVADTVFRFSFVGFMVQDTFAWGSLVNLPGLWSDVWKPVLMVLCIILAEGVLLWALWRRKAET